VHKLLPEAFHKQLVNVRKAQERKKRESVSEKHSGKQQTDDGEDESLLQSVKKSQPERLVAHSESVIHYYCCSLRTAI